jgi:phage tail sheath protein FI
MANYSTPGVYIEEIPKFPPSVAQVETAIPAFIGYTQKADELSPGDLINIPRRIGSMLDYEVLYGYGPSPVVTEVLLDGNNNFLSATVANEFYMYDSLRMFFANGGGDCYIVAVATYTAAAKTKAEFLNGENGLKALEKVDEPTILLFPDAVLLATGTDMYDVQKEALAQCDNLKDRVGLFDLKENDPKGIAFRNNIGINFLKYGMAYTPWLKVTLPKNIKFVDVKDVVKKEGNLVTLNSLTTDADILQIITDLTATPTVELENELASAFPVYKSILTGINNTMTGMPPSGAVAGVYAMVDRTRGVWKTPANVSLNYVIEPVTTFRQTELDALNIDTTSGKSINAIRSFFGKGTLIYGGRTLAGNDNEWRYVSVRRFFNMVEESVKKATEQFVFEPNDANTWVKVQAMIENFLLVLWRQGAMQGAKPEHAFYVAVGLGKTMTALDILEGRMNIEIGMAVVRPAEFIILKFSHKMVES